MVHLIVVGITTVIFGIASLLLISIGIVVVNRIRS